MSILDSLENYQQRQQLAEPHDFGGRSKDIERTSMVGIVVNVGLFLLKIIVGFVTGSIAIINDGVNNLTDALSSVLVIIGARLSNRLPDYNHPFGYGRTEYIATVAIGAVILFGGTNAFHEAVEHIRTPVAASYSTVMLLLMVAAVVAKLALAFFFRRRGRDLGSDALAASGNEALLDVVATTATIVSALITSIWGVSTEAYLAAIISLSILKAGFDTLLQGFSKILGQRISSDVSAETKAAVEDIKGVEGTCDWRLSDFGPKNVRGSVYLEVDERLSVAEADRIARAAQLVAFEKGDIRLDAVGIMPVSCADDDTRDLRRRVSELALAHEHVIAVQGFRVSEKTKMVTYDAAVDFDVDNYEALAEELADEAARELPGHRFFVTISSYMADFAD